MYGEGVGVCFHCHSVGHRVAHDTNVREDPLKVDRKARRGQLEKKFVNGEAERVVCSMAVMPEELKGFERIREGGN